MRITRNAQTSDRKLDSTDKLYADIIISIIIKKVGIFEEDLSMQVNLNLKSLYYSFDLTCFSKSCIMGNENLKPRS